MLVKGAKAVGVVVPSSPAVSNGIVYVGSYDGSLYAFNATTGAQLWSVYTSGNIYSSPAVADGVVYLGSGGSLDAFDAATGAELWSATTGALVYSSPAVSNGMIYVGSYVSNLYAYALNGGDNAVYHTKLARPKTSNLHPDFRLRLQH